MNEPHDIDPSSADVSKSQRKREANALQILGERLLTLSETQLQEIEIPNELRDAVKEAKSIKARGGLKRQLQFIGKIMRNIDTDPVEQFFARLDNKDRELNAAFHQLETWRERMINEGDSVITELRQKFPDIDLQHVRQLIRNAKNTKNEKLSTKAKREIFQYLKQLQSQS